MDRCATRRRFVGSLAAFGAAPFLPAGEVMPERPLRFILMADHHVESDFVQSHGSERGEPVYTCWKPGNHAAIAETYAFINADEACREADFALFCGDQINTGYDNLPKDMADEMVNYRRLLEGLDLHRKTTGKTADLAFRARPWKTRENLGSRKPYDVMPSPPISRVIALQGNHDTGVDAFYRDCAFTAGDTRFIGFFASYCGLPSPRKGVYASTGKIADATVDFVAEEMRLAAADPKIRHIVLASHWAIAPKGRDFSCPIIGACASNKMNANRDRLLALAEQYGCDLYINGHEHNGAYPVGRAGVLNDVNCGSLTGGKGAWALVEIGRDKALFHVYSRAVAQEEAGRVVVTRRPQRLFTREVPLKPLHI